MSRITLVALSGLLTFGAFQAMALNQNQKVQEAMREYVELHTSEQDLFPVVYKGKVLQLKLAKSKKYPDGFHQGVQNSGNYFASCADFVDPETGKKYDIDFLVNKVKGQFAVVQPIVHSVDGKKNPYDLGH